LRFIDPVTLVLSIHSRDTLWVVVDRRLSYEHRPPSDTAVKVTILETLDGIAVLAYAGLGATSQGTEPSDWMSAVLRGREGLTLEQALAVLADAATNQLPKHLQALAGGAHSIVIPAFIKDVGPRVYTIDNVVDPKTKEHSCRYENHQASLPGSPSPRLFMAGTGGRYLSRDRSGWRRDLLRIAYANDQGKISDQAVADHLGKLNYNVHQKLRDGTVGPRCIVVWRRRPGSAAAAARSAGGHCFYADIDREKDIPAIPNIGNGMDVQAIVEMLMPELQAWDPSSGAPLNPFGSDVDAINRRLAEIPSEPDEELR
jgi:hypothetical protein